MAGVFIILTVLFAFGTLIPENEAVSNSRVIIPVPDNARIQAPKGRKCLNVLWDSPCDPVYDCKVTLKIKLQRGGLSDETVLSPYKPAITNNNASYIQCIYDSTAGENVSCCNSINSEAQLVSGTGLSFSNNEKIGFNIKVCVNGTHCASKPYYYNFILPWRNPCFFDKPCENSGVCNAGVDAYNCTCMSQWMGDNCTSPKDFTHHAKKCLDYSSKTDVKMYMKTLAECVSACQAQSSPLCKAFEFQKMSSGNLGNCTLHDSNTVDHKLVACDADLYENNGFLTGGSGPTVAIVTLHLLFMLLASIFLSEY